ncbi:MAG: acyltransferase [SAR324 cluster bacterium]|nr:acyltransferase [SAR324 cluster bacterium]
MTKGSFILGCFNSLLVTANTLLVLLLIPFTLLKIMFPVKGIRLFCNKAMVIISNQWIDNNSKVLTRQKTQIEISGDVENLSLEKSYLVISNHQSWADIVILQYLFNRKIPFLRFFLKRELIWVPLLGFAWWALDFPFMKRYSKEYLKKHPEMKGKDYETTRKACEKFKELHVSVINFLEGTRFTHEKHKNRNSRFQYLLNPKAGGIALVMSSMGDYINNILNITIVYPGNHNPPKFWDLLSGNIPAVKVHIEEMRVPPELIHGNYEEDDAFRQNFQEWVNQLWISKDQNITRMKGVQQTGSND